MTINTATPEPLCIRNIMKCVFGPVKETIVTNEAGNERSGRTSIGNRPSNEITPPSIWIPI